MTKIWSLENIVLMHYYSNGDTAAAARLFIDIRKILKYPCGAVDRSFV